jgi:uncharacterized RDD family membrane protein YckC
MKKIEISTAQNVIIQYELATLRDRILAFSIDSLVLWTALSFLFFLVWTFALRYLTAEHANIITTLLLSPIFIFYTLVSEVITNGRTLGKIAMGLKVLKVNGGVPKLGDYVMRWVFRSIDIYTSLGAIAALMISSSDKSQRLGDLLSNTAVVKLKEDYNIRLDDLEKMFESTQQYQPSFPGVVQFNDDEMLAIKELVNRYQTHPNKSITALLEEVTLQIAAKLSLEKTPVNKIGFLQSILKDYVMLTR